jgi:LCP family protein required for cell wall assembly
MIVSINPYTHEILLTSIPRDYYVQVHGKTGLKDKLTHAGIYGMNTSAKTVGDLFDIEIDYSVKVGMNAVVEVVDLVGGIEVYSDITFNSYHMPGWTVKKGMNKMDGKKALAYARERYAYASGDRHRIKNQQQVLEAVLKKAMTNKSLLLKYDKLLSSLGKFYKTDISGDVIKAFMQEQLETMPTWTFTTQTVDGKGASLPTYTAPNYKRYVMIPYEDDVRKASINIKSLISRK